VLREISCSDKHNKTWLTAWEQSNYTHFLLIQNYITPSNTSVFSSRSYMFWSRSSPSTG